MIIYELIINFYTLIQIFLIYGEIIIKNYLKQGSFQFEKNKIIRYKRLGRTFSKIKQTEEETPSSVC